MLTQARQLESDDSPTILEAGLVVDVGLVAGLDGAGHLEHAVIKVSLLDVGHPVGCRAVPAIPDRSGQFAVLFAVEAVSQDERAIVSQPCGIIGSRRNGGKKPAGEQVWKETPGT